VFDFRYHALSLVAVFVALGIGLLLGVAVGDQELVGSARKKVVAGLGNDLKNARKEADDLRGQVKQHQDFEDQAFPALVSGQLVGQRVGLIFLGGSSREVYDDVRDAVDSAGGELSFTAVVREPPDLGALGGRAGDTRYGDLGADGDLLRPFAERVGRGLVLGGDLARRERSALFDSFSGELDGVDAVIVARSGERKAGDDGVEETRTLEEGLVTGMRETQAPAVGVELTDTDPSHVGWYRDRGIASVDDVDDVSGRVALVYTLTGRADGAYGVKGSAEGILPRVVEGQDSSGG
jgi:Copper transport outer membrane protein, MctB